jgi:hypothetical protein
MLFPQGGYKKAFEEQIELTNVFFQLSLDLVDNVAESKKEVELLKLKIEELEIELEEVKSIPF